MNRSAGPKGSDKFSKMVQDNLIRTNCYIAILLFLAIIPYADMALSFRAARKLTATKATGARSFMGSLPLSITVTSPVGLVLGRPCSMSGSQDITVVFSRPVIALGSDFENDGNVKKVVPFQLSCNWPGTFRWVTTSIARYDPSESWPSDLQCDVIWNTALRTYDGVPLQLGNISARSPLQSAALSIWRTTVTSDLANNVTGGRWDSGAVLDGDKAPEVPPDGHLHISFSDKVHLQTVASAFKLSLGYKDNLVEPNPKLNFTVRPCTSPELWATPEGSSLDINTTCADVEVGPSLEPDTWYTLRLPSGTKYSAASGPLSRDLDVLFAGLRRFRIPFFVNPSRNTANPMLTTMLRRWDMDLLHGLARGTTEAQLASAFTVCERVLPTDDCSPVPFNLTFVGLTTARLSVPGAQPAKAYRIYVSGSSEIRDGLGMPLEASSADIGMMYVPYAFKPPSSRNPLFAVLEPEGVDALTHWPYITRAPSPSQTAWPANGYPVTISSYFVDVTNQSDIFGLMSAMQLLYGYYLSYKRVRMGNPDLVTTVNQNLTTPGTGAEWTQVTHPLGSSQLQLIEHCCIPMSETFTQSTVNIILRTDLSLSVVQSGQYFVAWVTDAVRGGGAGPVAAAKVSINSWYYDGGVPKLEASCTTNVMGYCMMQLHQAGSYQRLSALAVVRSENGMRTAMLPNSGFTKSQPTLVPYTWSVVLDRKIVEPGDSVKITGFVQKVSLKGLSPPNASYVMLTVDPDYNPSVPDTLFKAVARVNDISGSFHAEIKVPTYARMNNYNIGIRILTNQATAPDPTDATLMNSLYYLGGAAFTVSSPRHPTAELVVATDPWVQPNGTVTVKVTAISYLGASVGGSIITVTWSIASVSSANGVLKLTTDSQGFASSTIDLAPVAAAAAVQGLTLSDAVNLKVEWIGPTRERITKSLAVTIADAAVRIAFSTSVQTDIPNIPFAVVATLTSSADGSQLHGIPITAVLSPKAGATCNTTLSCAIPTGAGGFNTSASQSTAAPCRLALPCVGIFDLRVCANVSGSGSSSPSEICSNTTIGRNVSQWADDPLSHRVEPILQLDKPGGYRPGESPRLLFENPYSGARVLAVWGTAFDIKAKAFTQLPAGVPFNETIGPLGSECTFSCTATIVLDVPRATSTDLPTLPPSSQLPVATLFDPRAPHSHVMRANLIVLSDNELTVSVAVGPLAGAEDLPTVEDSSGAMLPVVEPGATAQVIVDVESTALDGPVEVTVYGVDKAYLDILPYDLQKPQLDMLVRLYQSMDTFTLDAYRIAPGAVRAVFDKLMMRLTQLDPWLPVDTSVNPSGSSGRDPVDTSDDVYLAAHTTRIAYKEQYAALDDRAGYDYVSSSLSVSTRPPPSRARGDPVESGAVKDNVISDSSTTAVDLAAVRSAMQFIVTPLFSYSMADSQGRAAFNFTAPQNLGAFVIRAFAAAGRTAKYGAAEGKLVVRRRLSLTPSVPQFVRVGDTFEAGVVVTVGSAPATVNVTLQVLNSSKSSIRVAGLTSKSVTFFAGDSLQAEVRFNFTARAIGTTSLVFIASDSAPGGGKDSLQVDIDAEGQQGDVWLATSFALASNASASNGSAAWVEGIELPAAVPGSGGLTLVAAVGYLPAVMAVYDNLQTTEDMRTDPYAQTAMMWVTMPAVLSYYSQSPTNGQAVEVAQAVQDLKDLTSSSYGLQWMLPTKWASWSPSRANIYLNTWALFLVNFYTNGLQKVTGPLVKVVGNCYDKWRRALDFQITSDVNEAQISGYEYNDWNTLAWIRLALGANWTPTTQYSSSVLAAVSLNRTLAAYQNSTTRNQFDRETRILLSLVLLSMGRKNPYPQLISETVLELTSSFRVQGRTAYVAWGPGYPGPASLQEQALALLLFVRSGTKNQLVPRLATYVANGLSSSGGRGLYYYYASWTTQSVAVAALTEYDVSRGSSKPTLDLEAEVNGLTVLEASFRVNKTRPVTNTTAWETMPAPPRGKLRELDFQVSGSGEVTVAASLHFVPATLPSFPAFRGISVDLAIQLVDPLTGGATGPRVSAVPLGSVVMLTVQISTPDDLGAVTLSIMMPGGLEPLDPNLVSDAGSSCIMDWFGSDVLNFFYPRWWWWPICPSRETRPSLVTFSYATLRSGTSYATIKAVAATAGTFVVPPVRVSVDEQPEVMGMTAGASFNICTACTSATPAPPPRVPRPCPEDCSQNGVCNLRTGVCVCDEGYTGKDCASLAVL
ncbi:hypothetical protein Vretimale_7087 [Volvox reticuliferus]|uniref:EGF-like domain-containing protein n=1 Tax=Volvox reticuliferus TaxID=1737510 RepID=A0A8J4LLP2_9CHLO|nr:hypothetical protein Vretimale_7087 [Volvox reticuliferus]